MTDTSTDTRTATGEPGPGWYPDPMAAGHERWWSGEGWTEYQQPAPVIEPVAPVVLPEIVVPADEPLALERAQAAAPAAAAVPVVPVAAVAPSSAAPFTSADAGAPTVAPPAPVFADPFADPAPAFGGYDPAHPVLVRETRYPPAHEVLAPPPENVPARKGLPFAILALVVNILAIPGIAAIVYGTKGIRRARELEWQGVPRAQSRHGLAVFELVAGIAGTALMIVAIITGVWAALPHYDRTAVQSAIATDVLSQSGQAGTVTCPPSPQYSTGSTFDCSVAFPDGTVIWAAVTVRGAQGDITWRYLEQPSSAGS